MPLRTGPSSRATCGLCGAPNATLPVLTLLTFVPILNRKKVMLFSDALQKTQKAQAAYQDTATWTCVPPYYCIFWEWGGSLLGNDVNAKVQNITKMQLQSSEASRWKEFCTRTVHMNVLVRNLAGGKGYFWVCEELCYSIWSPVPVCQTGKMRSFTKVGSFL